MRWLIIVFIVIEAWVTIQLGGYFGALNTFLEIVLTALVGVVIIMNFKAVLMQSMMALMSQQLTPKELIKGNLLSFIGALLLVLPGFITDTVGIVFQLGYLKNLILSRVRVPNEPSGYSETKKGDDDVIDVEIIEHNSDRK